MIFLKALDYDSFRNNKIETGIWFSKLITFEKIKTGLIDDGDGDTDNDGGRGGVLLAAMMGILALSIYFGKRNSTK